MINWDKGAHDHKPSIPFDGEHEHANCASVWAVALLAFEILLWVFLVNMKDGDHDKELAKHRRKLAILHEQMNEIRLGRD